MKGRTSQSEGYRYGFNGQERDDDAAEGSYTAEFWHYSPSIAKRWNTDPVTAEWESPYAVFRNNPIFWNDPKGDCPDCDNESYKVGSDTWSYDENGNGTHWRYDGDGKWSEFDEPSDAAGVLTKSIKWHGKWSTGDDDPHKDLKVWYRNLLKQENEDYMETMHPFGFVASIATAIPVAPAFISSLPTFSLGSASSASIFNAYNSAQLIPPVANIATQYYTHWNAVAIENSLTFRHDESLGQISWEALIRVDFIDPVLLYANSRLKAPSLRASWGITVGATSIADLTMKNGWQTAGGILLGSSKRMDFVIYDLTLRSVGFGTGRLVSSMAGSDKQSALIMNTFNSVWMGGTMIGGKYGVNLLQYVRNDK